MDLKRLSLYNKLIYRDGVSAQVSGFCKWTKSLFDDCTALFDNYWGTLVGPSALPIFYCKPRGADKPTQGKVTWGKGVLNMAGDS